MIIGKIGSEKFILASIDDAEELMKIINRATPVDDTYDANYQSYYYPSARSDVSINITQARFVTNEEHTELRLEREAKNAAEALKKAEKAT